MSLTGYRTARVFLFALFLGGASCLRGGDVSLPDGRDPVSGMGVNIHFTDPKPGELEMLARAGFRWIRMDLTWSQTEKAAGVYDFSAYDRLLTSLDKFHIHALLILDYTNQHYDGGKPTCTDEGRAAFARWAVAAVNHFKDRGVIWEIWNEPNGAWFWKPKANADDYAKLALTVSKAIHEAAPHEIVVGPALSGIDPDFLEPSAKAGVLAYWSAITIHPYLRKGPESYIAGYDQTRRLIEKYAAPEEQIAVMCGESGYSTAWPAISDETQGKYLSRLFLFDVASGVPMTIWYDWHDDGSDLHDQESNFGIVHFDYHAGAANVYDPKPAYLAAQTYSQELAGYRLDPEVTTKTNVSFLLSFRKGADSCTVAWTTLATPYDMVISEPEGTYEITNYDGTKRSEVQAVNGTVTVTLDDGPEYIKRRFSK